MEDEKPYVDTCTACGTQEPADAKGLCPNPKCRCVRKGTKLAAKFGPINVSRRKELRDALEHEYRPASPIDKHNCRLLANILERLEVAKSGTQEQQRMIQSQGILVEALSASLAARTEAATANGRLMVETMTVEQLEIRSQALDKIQRYLRQQAPVDRLNLDGLISETERLLSNLRAMQTGSVSRQAAPPMPAPEMPETDDDFDSPEDEDLIEDPDALQARILREEQELAQMKRQLAVQQQPAAVKCPWCCQTPCVGPQHPAFDILHSNDPDIIRQRDEQATAEMHESMRRNGRIQY